MTTDPFTGREVANALLAMGYGPARRAGVHVTLSYRHPESGAQGSVTIPIQGTLATGTLRAIAAQCGASDFDAWCEQVDAHR